MNQAETTRAESVAIIGMAARLPGASTLEEFWRNLVQGVGAISTFSRDELDHCHADGDPENASRYVPARSVLEGEDLFDAAFFEIYPKQAETMDPQHRIFLECAWEALESAGYNPETYPGLIGLYAGLSLNTYLLYNLSSKPGFAPAFAASYPGGSYDTLFGNDKDFLTTRVAHKLNLRGPCVTVQTACSTSLVAVVQAYYSLLTYQCDIALAGGVSITFPQRRDYLYHPDGMVSRDGTCRTFDADASGTVFGSGAGIVVLKRLTEALTDGDHIHAVILGGAINNDGAARVGYSAPGVEGQATVITLAHDVAGVSADTISYVEAHGTGTPLGDPIEVAALTQAFRRTTQRKGFCALGSAKTNVGHLDMAAGVTGLIKTTLQLEHDLIPPLLHFRRSNPHIDFANSPFVPVAELMEWPRNDTPRRAGVSAFGVGGTNAHIVLEESPLREQPSPGRPLQLLVLSARTEAALEQASRNLAKHLSANPAISLADVAFTLQQGRKAFPQRRVLIASDAADAAAKLEHPEPKTVFASRAEPGEPSLVFLFPGQGAQYVDMGRQLYEDEPVFRAEVDRCAAILERYLETDIRRTLYPNAEGRAQAQQQINETWITQPAIFVVEYALARLWLSWGVKPSVLIGHSIGEYTCAVLAETFTLEDALKLLSVRAKLMQALPGGAMLSVRLGIQELEAMLPAGASIAALNAPQLAITSGPTPLLQQFQRELEGRKVPTRFLRTSHAFHSEMMDPMLPEFTTAAQQTPNNPPKLPWVSTSTGRWMTSEEIADGSYWARQVRQRVRFADALQAVIAEPRRVLLEIGPGQTLCQLTRQHPSKAADLVVLATLGPTPECGDDLSSILQSLSKLWLAGVKPDWNGFCSHEKRRRVPLPTYAFERKRHWVEPMKTDAGGTPRDLRCVTTLPSPGDPIEPVPLVSPAATGQNDISIMPPSTPSAPGTRLERLATQLRASIKELSGIDVTDDQSSFMELGFDSLFLTQVSQALHAKFGVKITFRQLLAELSTVAALAEYLDQHLTAEPTVETPAASRPPQHPLPLSIPGNSSLEQLLAQQMETIQLLLAQQRGEAANPAATPSKSLPVVKWPNAKPPSSAVSATGESFKRFGPYKPIEKGEKEGLTPRQQKALDDLISRYVKKTASSKSYAAEHRPHFADPRAVAGFKSNWKEMVYPIVAARSEGSKIWDLDGNDYVDITMGFGTYFFGHSPKWIIEALQEQLRTGMEIGPQSPLAGKVAKLICEFTGLDRVTFCNTGSEAVMAAIRVARTVTGRPRIVYFTGDYHGMFDEVLVRGSWINGEYHAQPIAPGIPATLVENMLVLDYGSPESLEIIKAHANEIAAVMIEPVQSRQPGSQPREFMRELRAVTERSGVALIVDEVVTGFRCHPGGAQAYFGIQADLATYGKIIGGGMPIGVLAGKRQFMDALDGGTWQYGDDSFPEVGVTFFAGTFVRHPLAIAAAWRVLNYLKEHGPKLQLEMTERVARACRTLNEHFTQREVPIRLPHFSAFAMIEHAHDLKYASLLWYYLREKGIHVWEGRPCFFTLAHTDDDFDRIIRAFKDSVAEMQDGGFLPESPTGSNRLGLPAPGATEFPRLDQSPLSEGQREIFFSVQMGDEANCAYNESLTVTFKGALAITALEDAWLHLIERHPALRSTFSSDGKTQFFHPAPGELRIAMQDLSSLSDLAADAEYKELCAIEQRTPFDLAHGPLLRLRLVKLAPARHVLIFTAHHLVCDGWSIGMLLAELSALYNARQANQVPRLLPPMPFGDFARHQAKQQESPGVQKAEEFWIQQFGDGAPTLELPTDRQRPPIKTYPGAMESRMMDFERFARLKKATPQLGGTVFVTLLSSCAALLHRLTGQQDLVIGVPAAGQTMIGCSELVGHCLNFLPLRLRFDGNMPFAAFAKSVQAVVLEAYEHQNFTYGTLLQKLKLPRDTSRLPLVSVMFNIDKAGLDLLKFDGLDFQVITNPKQFVNFDLFFNLVQNETSLKVECEYNTDLFDRTTILRWMEAFETLVDTVLVNGETKLSELSLLSPAARQQMLHEFNNTARDYPRNQTVHALFEQQAKNNPSKIAVRCGEQFLAYGKLNEAADKLASQLRHLGAKPGILVGLCVDRSLDMVVGVLGILKTGAAYVPMDPAYPAERLRMMLEDASMPIVVIQSALITALPTHTAALLQIDPVFREVASASALPSDGSAEDLAYVMFTSGSTGRPKGVQISHRAVVNFLNAMRREPGLMPDDVLLSVTTLSFDIAGLELFLPLTTGATVAIAPRQILADGNLLKNEIERVGATIMQATPATWRLLLDAGWKGSKELKILVGGEAVPRKLVDQLLPRCGSVWNVYGPTETTIWSTTHRLTAGEGPVSIGRPIDNTQVYIVNRSLQLQPCGVAGELLIGGDGVAHGYHGQPQLTTERFLADPFRNIPGARVYRTGDLAKWRPDGTLECLGRIDNQVKIRGFRIELGEIETALATHPGVKENVVAAREDVPGQKRLVAYFVATAPPGPAVGDLRAHLSLHLPDYMVPTAFVALEKLPLTPNGKVERRALPAPASMVPSTHSVIAPRTPQEKRLADIWKHVLGHEAISVEDNIFDLGGDSILIFQITSRANEAGLALSPLQVFRHPTIAELANLIEPVRENGNLLTTLAPISRADRAAFRKK